MATLLLILIYIAFISLGLPDAILGVAGAASGAGRFRILGGHFEHHRFRGNDRFELFFRETD